MKEPVVEYFDTFPTRDELTYHRSLSKLNAKDPSGRVGYWISDYGFEHISDVTAGMLSAAVAAACGAQHLTSSPGHRDMIWWMSLCISFNPSIDIKDEVMKQVDEDMRHSQALVDTSMIFENASKADKI
ncbi:hypothetical protein Tco_0628236 [Tanacetum coccineum]|uniref:Uncharacterized protein n=1 Tax=Tanacetum coccineum TaxID=301880 RepID=A0ABQ4WPQ7_9ASTR